MEKGEKKIYENEGAASDSEETIPDSEETVKDDAAAADDATVDDEAAVDDDATVDDEATADDTEAAATEKKAAFEKGRIILGTYRVESNAVKGGMGEVWRVHHTGWAADLAMKRPKAKFIQTEKQKENFIRECEVWINLGLHPHIVSCYYVREIESVPAIFSEWMDGGSLKSAIEDGRLYAGSAAEQQERILDIAIQFARGLHYAHECRDDNGEPRGLIHQDVKPDNLLLTKSGEAKVADFGIAKARATLTLLDAEMPADATMFSQGGGYTPAYCSMEQKNGEKLTRRTDIYSWAVSVMEMYLGERLWQDGVIAGAACDRYFPEAGVTIPEAMKALLKECMNKDADKRPHDFAAVEERLLAIYRDALGRDYSRISPQATADTADSLNNRALSFLDMGKPEETEKCWQRALSLAPDGLEANYNYALYLWHTLRIDDTEVRSRIDRAAENNKEAPAARLLSAQAYLERGNREQALNQIAAAEELDKTAAEALRSKALSIPSITVTQTINAHEIAVSALALSPDERYLATGGGEKEKQLKLWDAHSLQCIKGITLDTQSKTGKYHYSTFFEVIFVAVSQNARFILCYDNLLRLRLWEMESGARIKQLLDGELDGVAAIGFADDDKTVWAATLNGAVRRWDRETLLLIDSKDGIPAGEYLYPEHRGVFSGDGRLLLRKDRDDGRKLCLWDTDKGGSVACFELPANITAFNMEAGCQRMAASCEDGFARVFDLQNKQMISRLPVAENKRVFLAGSRLFAACRQSLKLYDIGTGKCQRSFGYANSFYLAVNTAGSRLYAETGSGIYACSIPDLSYRAPWALSRIVSFAVRSGYEEVFRSAVLRAEESLARKDIHSALAALQQAQAVPGYESSGQCLELSKSIGRYCRAVGIRGAWPRKRFDCNAYTAAFLTNERVLLGSPGAGSNGEMREINLESGGEDYKYKDSGRVIATRIRMDGKYLLALVQTNMARYLTCRHIVGLYDATTGDKLQEWTSQAKEGIVSFALDPAGKYVAIGTLFDQPSGNSWGRIAIYELPAGGLLHECAARGNISGMSFAHDGKRLFTSFYWWNEAEREETDCTETVSGKRLDVKPFGKTLLFPDGQTAISTEGKTNMVLWRTDGSGPIRRIGNCSYDPVAVSPDCRFLLMEGAANSKHTSLEIWDAARQTLLMTLKNGAPKTRSAAFSPNGQQLLYGPEEWEQLWDIDWQYEFPGWSDWDEGAKPYLEIFLRLCPDWGDTDFDNLVTDLQNRGYGWLRPDGIKKKLKEMADGLGGTKR